MCRACSNGQALDCSASARRSLGLAARSIVDINWGLRAAETKRVGLELQNGNLTAVIPGRCNASNPESRDSGSGATAPARNDEAGNLERTDGKIAQPQVGVAAFFPDPEQRPVQRLPQQVVALAHGNPDALAEIAALDEGSAREGAAI